MFTLRLSVNMQTLSDNVAALKRLTSAKLCAVVKADAYGLGIRAVAAMTAADEFAVACAAEADELLKYTAKPVNILSLPDKTVKGYRCGMYPSVASERDAEFARSMGARSVNVKVNTGMNRYGVSPGGLGNLLKACAKLKLAVKSVFSHVYDLSAAAEQFELFMSCVKPYADCIPQKHLLCSNFAVLPQYMHLDMVRPGIVLYGYGNSCVKPAATAECAVTQVREIEADDNVGYGSFKSGARRKIAVLSAGYADGIRRITNGEPRYVMINGFLCLAVGQVCMDAMFADISGLNVCVGDTAYIMCGEYGADSIAAACGTVNYEILTGFGRRVIREYV